MPENKKLIPKKFPMPIRFGEKPTTNFKNNLNSIKLTLVQAPSYDEIKTYCIPFANATWGEHPLELNSKLKDLEKDLLMHHIFSQKILPTTMETIRVNFLIEGICLQEVTHILRYRKAVFSAECSGDKWLTHKDSLVPTSIENSAKFLERYKRITEMSKQLYCDMIDSKEISVQDARYILPRNIETFYFMSMSLKDALLFIWDRIDKQIQPMTDNVLAYRMMQELINKYPILIKTLSAKYLHQPSKFYVATARQNRSTNWYKPDVDSDIFEYNIKDFVYGKKERGDLLGTDKILANVFNDIFKEIKKYLLLKEIEVDLKFGTEFFNQDTNCINLEV